jgi:phosphatidylserine decarboxylase
VITKYGVDVVAVVLVVAVAVSLLSWFLIDIRALKYTLIAVALFLLAFTLYFFRDPDRSSPAGERLVLAPADGTIVQVTEVQEAEFLAGPAVQVSIFMSPLNVHVNRYPVTGRVGLFRHIPGEFLVAFDDKSSSRNERTLIGIESPHGRLLFKQIAGFVARRIVAPVQVGDSAVAGARFGMIRFGSRVDILLPPTTRLRVQVGDRTTAGETVLGELN